MKNKTTYTINKDGSITPHYVYTTEDRVINFIGIGLGLLILAFAIFVVGQNLLHLAS